MLFAISQLKIRVFMSKKSNAKSGVGGVLSSNIDLKDSPIKVSRNGIISIRKK